MRRPGYWTSAVLMSGRMGVIPLPAARKNSRDCVLSLGSVKSPEAPMVSS